MRFSNNSKKKKIGRGVTARELVDLISLKIFRVSWNNIWGSLAVKVWVIMMG